MSGLYIIPLTGMKEGRYSFDFEIGKEFFEQFEESEIKEGSLIAYIEMDKKTSHADLSVRVSGKVKICCDRCLEEFFHVVESKNRLLVKFGKSMEENDPDIITVPAEENELDLRQQIYEFIYLALPIRRVHPDDINGNSTCDPDMLRKLEEFLIDDEKENDPRWDGLKKLINDN